MSGYKTFAVWGAGSIGKLLVEEFLRLKSIGSIDDVLVLTRVVRNDIIWISISAHKHTGSIGIEGQRHQPSLRSAWSSSGTTRRQCA